MKLLAATLAALAAFALPAHANVPQLNATCPTGITVKINHGGVARINGKKAALKTVNDSYWEVSHDGITISIAKDGAELIVSYTLKGGANGICQVKAEDTAEDGSGGPSKDEQACLQAVSQQTNNGDVTVLETNTSEANNTFIIGVGPDRARWQCLVKNGIVAGVMSLTDEGAL